MPNWQAFHSKRDIGFKVGMANLSLAKEGWCNWKCYVSGEIVVLNGRSTFSIPKIKAFLFMAGTTHLLGLEILKTQVGEKL